MKAFGGNEKFNPLVTSSKLDGYCVGSKRVCYVSIDGGKNVSKTIEILAALNEESRTMEYKVTNAPNTPFEGLINRITVNELQTRENMMLDHYKCSVEVLGKIKVNPEMAKENVEKIIQETYDWILHGLKDLHEKC